MVRFTPLEIPGFSEWINAAISATWYYFRIPEHKPSTAREMIRSRT